MTYITYQSDNAPAGQEWCAYLTKFKVFCFGSTEEQAKANAQRFYEKVRSEAVQETASDWGNTSNWSTPAKGSVHMDGEGKTHHFSGKVWMRHKDFKLIRVPADQVAALEAQGYYRSGPRGK